MTPWASSGHSIRSSSSTVWSTRRTSVGSRAVTDAVRGAGSSTASSPTVAAGTELDDRALAAVHTHTALHDRVEVGLDGSLLHEHLARREALLDGRLGHRGEHAARSAGEELDAVERGDALDEPERFDGRGRSVHHHRRT